MDFQPKWPVPKREGPIPRLPTISATELELHCDFSIMFGNVLNLLVMLVLFKTTFRNISRVWGRVTGSVNPLLRRSVLIVEDEPLHRTRTLKRIRLCWRQHVITASTKRSACAELARDGGSV